MDIFSVVVIVGLLLSIFIFLIYNKKGTATLVATHGLLKEQNAQLEGDYKALETALQESKQTIGDLNTQLAVRQNDLANQQQQHQKLGEEKATLTEDYRQLTEDFQQARQEVEVLKNQLKTSEEHLQQQQKVLKETQEALQKDFKQIANEIFKENTKQVKEDNQEQLAHILNPLKENIQKFERTVKDNYDNENKDRATLKTELKNLLDLNHKLSDDAHNLTQALKGDNKAQGDWGEIQLKMILEKAGLQKENFKEQVSMRDEDGKVKRPDFIINLPDNKNLIVDAKVSLVAYERYCNSENSDEKAKFLKAHVNSLKAHVKGLSEKKYQQLYDINTPDYVLLFVPIEASLSIALQDDIELFNNALAKNIVLVSPTTLMATMKTISFIWRQDNQKQNVLKMAQQCGMLYDKFVDLTEDLIKVGKQMGTAKKTYDMSMRKLADGRNNIVSRVENIKKLGANTSKDIDPALKRRALSESEN